MVAFHLDGSDEGRHLPGPETLWGESWYHDFAAADGSYGGYLRLGLYPNQDVVWYWLHLVRAGEPLVLIRDHAVPCPPRDASLDLAHGDLRALWQCTEPWRRWHVTTEGTGTVLPNPAEAFHGERGEQVPVRIDLEWEGIAPCFPYAETTRYEQSARVAGEMVIGDQRIEVSCPGQRDHSWGVRDWWLFPWIWTSGRLDDGTWWHAVRSLVPGVEVFQTGYVIDPDLAMHPVDRVDATPELDGEKLPLGTQLRIGDLELTMTAELHAPVLLVSPGGKQSRFPRALCRFETPDGRHGRGWTEFNWPDGFPA